MKLRLRACRVVQSPSVGRAAGQPETSGGVLDEEQDVEAVEDSVSTVKKSHSRMLTAC